MPATTMAVMIVWGVVYRHLYPYLFRGHGPLLQPVLPSSPEKRKASSGWDNFAAGTKMKKAARAAICFSGDPKGVRTPVTGVRGRCPNR
jgi:hypothetical protein